LRNRPRGRQAANAVQAPTLPNILEALMQRVGALLPGKPSNIEDVLSRLSAAERASFEQAREQAARVRLRSSELGPAPKFWPGRWIGAQTFSSVPAALTPYLALASILHIGKHTHFGCGTFVLD